MENLPYLYRQYNWPFKIIYSTYQDKFYSEGDKCEKLLIIKEDKIVVQGLWRMQLLGELYHGLYVLDYDDKTNWEYYEEVLGQHRTAEEREQFRLKNIEPDTYEEYFEKLAAIAAEIGCEQAEIKCLIKSLIFRYKFYKINNIFDLPHEAFNRLYHRLTSSKDMEQLRVAERLCRFHVRQLERYMNYNVKNKMAQLNRSEEEYQSATPNISAE